MNLSFSTMLCKVTAPKIPLAVVFVTTVMFLIITPANAIANPAAEVSSGLTTWLADTPTPLPTTQPPLAPELLNKMISFIARKGWDRDVPADEATALGLAAGQSWPLRGVSSPDPDVGDKYHGWAVSRGSDNDLLLAAQQGQIYHFYRITRDGTIIKAIIFNRANHQITMLDSAQAQIEVNAEYAWWAAAWTAPSPTPHS